MYLKTPTDSLLKCLSSRLPAPVPCFLLGLRFPCPLPWLTLPPPLCRVVDVQYLIANDGTDHTMAQLTLSLSDDASVLKASQAALSCLPARLPACSPSGLLTLMPNLTPGLSVCPPAPICLPACPCRIPACAWRCPRRWLAMPSLLSTAAASRPHALPSAGRSASSARCAGMLCCSCAHVPVLCGVVLGGRGAVGGAVGGAALHRHVAQGRQSL